MIDNAKKVIADGMHYDWLKDQLKEITKEEAINLDLDQRKLLAFHLTQAHLKGIEQAKDIVEGKQAPPANHSTPQQTEQPITTTKATTDLPVMDLINQFREHQLTSGSWRPGTARNAEPQLKALASYLGPETSICSLTVDHLRSYLHLLQALPPSFAKMKLYRDAALCSLNPDDVMNRHDRHLDTTTIRGYVTMAHSVFEYAVSLDMLDKNPCPSILIPKKKPQHAREERQAYTMDQLHQVFNPEIIMPWAGYACGAKYGNGGQAMPVGRPNPARILIPALALCTTGRLEEICGLRTVDIERTSEGTHIQIVSHDDRTLKNQNSDRTVPVIPSVAEGLLRYTGSVPEGLLFPQLTRAHGKLGHHFSKQWARYVRHRVGIQNTKIAPMHSLRHFIIDLLYKAMVPERVIKQLDGHAPGGGETGGRYAKGLEVETLREHCVPVIEEAVGGLMEKLIARL
jgi:integrase